MLISEKQKNLSWQIKTKDGMYYQPESLSILYQWIFENRLCVDDFVFNARDNDWTQIINVPELKGCFWQLLTNGDVVYGPISIGEMKQLFINSQLTSLDKVAIIGREGWVQINEIELLHDWLQDKEAAEIDYIQFINKLGEEFESRGRLPMPKEDKITRKLAAAEQQNKENKKHIKELETAKKELEEELTTKKKELEEILGDRDKISNRFKSLQNELETFQSELKEKALLAEELNKNIAQAEVNTALKDSEISQLRYDLTSAEEELQRTRNENTQLKQSVPDAIKSLDGTINELNNKNRELGTDIDELRNIISEKEKLLEKSNDTINELTSANRDLEQKIISLGDSVLEKDRTLEEKGRELQKALIAKENELNRLQDLLSNKGREAEDYISEITKLRDEIINKNEIIEKAKEDFRDIGTVITLKEDEITNLKRIVSDKEKDITGYQESIAKLQGELAEKDREIAGIEDLSIPIEKLKNDINKYKQDVEKLNAVITEKDAIISQLDSEKLRLNNKTNELKQHYEELLEDAGDKFNGEMKLREDTIGELKHNFSVLEEEYKSKIKEWEDAVNIQKIEYEKELSEKDKLWEETSKQEKEKLEKSLQDLEGGLAQKDAQIEGDKLEIERLQDALISQDKQWKERFNLAKDESERLCGELEKERDDLREGLTQNINSLILERDALQARLLDLEKSHEEIAQQENKLRKDLSDRERFIEQIKDEAERQKESYLAQIRDTEQRINEELDKTKQIVNQIQKEKDSVMLELEGNKEKFIEIKSQMERELEEAKRSLEHAGEENRTLQRQFYLEKQKLTKEYTETINKQDKLQKRGQLEREIHDRTKMKDELERLYNLIKENFSGLQKGSDEIHASLQNLVEDIDNKRLSLKYLTETGKREEKKGKSFQTEPSEESDIAP